MNGNGGFGFKGIGAGSGTGSGRGSHNSWEDGLPEDQPFDSSADDGDQLARLPLGEDERLPWLESPDDVDFDDEPVDAGRIVGFALIGVAALALIVGAIWWLTRVDGSAGDADGSLIAASKEPYKVRPQDAGGKVFEGTGDQIFEVSEGQGPQGSMAGVDQTAAAPVPAPVPAPVASSSPSPSAAPSSGGDAAGALVAAGGAAGTSVQIGAFSTRAAAEAAWSNYQSQHSALQGAGHRVVEGRADIGTVYRLQAVAGSAAGARTLCSTLQASGLKCQVK